MKRVISTDKAPAAIGPYSQAIEANGFVFASGQIPVDPATGEIPEGIEAQTRQSMENVVNLLAAAGAKPEDVVKTTVFIKDMNDFAKVNAVMQNILNPSVLPGHALRWRDCPRTYWWRSRLSLQNGSLCCE